MTLTTLLLLTATQLPFADVQTPIVTFVDGTVIVANQSSNSIVQRGQSLSLGSRIKTAPAGSAIISWPHGALLYLGQQTHVVLIGGLHRKVELISGEIRLVVSSNRPGDIVVLSAGGCETNLTRGIIRAKTTTNGVRFLVEHGTAISNAVSRDANADAIQNVALKPSALRPVAFPVNKTILFESVTGYQITQERQWNIDVGRLQFAVAAALSREQRGQSTTKQKDNASQNNKSKSKQDASKGDDKKSGTDDKKKDDPKKDDPKTDKTDKTNKKDKKDPDKQDPTRGLPRFEEFDDDSLPTLKSSVASSNGQTGVGGISLALGNLDANSGAVGSSGGLFTDANQNTTAGMLTAAVPSGSLNPGDPFPGNIFPVTSESSYTLADIQLVLSDGFPVARQFWSIGLGVAPTTQVTTGIGTGTDPVPTTIAIPKFDVFLVRLDQYGVIDPASSAAASSQGVSISGLLGTTPINPDISNNITPLTDDRGTLQINDRLTFALGELAVDIDGDSPRISIRRSDQDRLIVKNAGGDDSLDMVTANPDVTEFNDTPDPLFFPANPTVKVPGRGPDVLLNRPTYRNINLMRRAAVTTLMAEQLFDFARRTGQTRFVVDGRILDITGYKR